MTCACQCTKVIIEDDVCATIISSYLFTFFMYIPENLSKRMLPLGFYKATANCLLRRQLEKHIGSKMSERKVE